MREIFKKNKAEVHFIALFLLFVILFSVFRAQIAEFSVWMLAMTHEVSLTKPKTGQDKTAAQEEVQRPIRITAQTPSTVKLNTAVARINPNISKQAAPEAKVTSNLPKTATPVIFMTNSIPDWKQAGISLFPPLRKYDGTAWDKEKTEFKVTTDGKKLYVICRAYDKNPVDAITSNSRKKKDKRIWEDDAIEIFIMKDSRSDHFCQYLVSASGVGQTAYHTELSKTNASKIITPPKKFEFPQFNVEEFDGGFEFEVTISLSNIGIGLLKPGDTLLMQLVRDYRGQNTKNSAILQLFPTHIYADSRYGANNTDRRGFQAVTVNDK